MSVLPAPPLPGGSGTFSIATWNIRSGRGAGLTAAAKGLCHLGVGCAVLTETKLTNEQYPKLVLGYRVISLEAASPQQGGVALLWRVEHRDFEVEAVNIISPNILTFQLITGEDQFFVLGAYIPPADTTGVDDLRTAWAKCPANCKPLLLGDLNIDFRAPRTEREEIIADLLNEINLVDMSRKFFQRQGQRQGREARWTWWQQRGGQWHQS
jgi:exonuclease III